MSFRHPLTLAFSFFFGFLAFSPLSFSQGGPDQSCRSVIQFPVSKEDLVQKFIAQNSNVLFSNLLKTSSEIGSLDSCSRFCLEGRYTRALLDSFPEQFRKMLTSGLSAQWIGRTIVPEMIKMAATTLGEDLENWGQLEMDFSEAAKVKKHGSTSFPEIEVMIAELLAAFGAHEESLTGPNGHYSLGFYIAALASKGDLQYFTKFFVERRDKRSSSYATLAKRYHDAYLVLKAQPVGINEARAYFRSLADDASYELYEFFLQRLLAYTLTSPIDVYRELEMSRVALRPAGAP
ncbi:MAG: hypothetical protein H6626_12720 [Pseudobdellovibrionaceae bacterium]|nr:hypothetical protein [Bdellovibrionales bacterium]USN47038.1 MAG: hypothetical protein H6626_12720 [Pseudobdellovibrionaceae bacterium]